MPRNSSGTYTLPTGNPVEAGDVITEAWANTTMADLGNEITNSLDRNGNGGMLAPFRLADGTLPAPGIAWLNEPSTGLYRAAAGEMWAAVLGQQIAQYTVNGVTIPVGKTLTLNGSLAGTYTVPVANGGTGATTAAAARTNLGAGDVSGPASSTNNAVAVFDGTTGKTLKNSSLTFNGATLQVSSPNAYYPQFNQINSAADNTGSYLVLDKIRDTAVVQSGDVLGSIVFRGYDGAAYHQAAAIMAAVGGTPGTNDMPGDLVILTTRDGQSAPTESLRVRADGVTTGLTVNAINGGQLAGLRNKIINGNFGINQRSYVSGAATSAGQYTLDRWKVTGTGGITFSTTNNKTTVTIPSGQTLQQVVEGLNLETGTYVLSWEGTAQGRIAGGSYGVSGAVTASVTGGTNTTIEFNTGTVAQVMLEKGTVATPFEHRPYGMELALCQRYYYRTVNAGGVGMLAFGGYVTSATTARAFMPLPVPMRIAPASIEVTGTATDYVWSIGAGSQTTLPTYSNVTSNQILAVDVAGSGLTVGQGVFLRQNSTAGYIGVPAEL